MGVPFLLDISSGEVQREERDVCLCFITLHTKLCVMLFASPQSAIVKQVLFSIEQICQGHLMVHTSHVTLQAMAAPAEPA